jgi:mannosyltransferase OCH1-like enzyme
VSIPEPIRNAINVTRYGAQKADILRYWIIYEHGGVYADADIVPHRSLDPIIAIGARVVVCHDLAVTWGYIINAFFAAAPKEPLLEHVSLKSLSVEYNTPDVHMKTGPRLFGGSLEEVAGKYTLIPTNMFYHNEGKPLRYGTHTYAHSWKQ